MTTVAQMIEALQKFPPDAEVECMKEVTRGFDTYNAMKPVDLDFTVIDYTSDADRIKYPNMAGKTLILIDAV